MAIILDGSTGIISPALDITTPMTIIVWIKLYKYWYINKGI